MRIDFEEVKKNQLIKFPLVFKIYKSGVDAPHVKQAHRRNTFNFTATDAYEKSVLEKLGKTDLYISTKNRLPTKQNCDIHIQGLKGTFYFGEQKNHEELLMQSEKLYMSF